MISLPPAYFNQSGLVGFLHFSMKNLIGSLPDCPLELIMLWSSDSWIYFKVLGYRLKQPVVFKVTVPTDVLGNWRLIPPKFSVCVSSLYPGLFCMFLSPELFLKISFGNTIRVSNSLDPDKILDCITSTDNVTNPPRWNMVLSRGLKQTAIHIKKN